MTLYIAEFTEVAVVTALGASQQQSVTHIAKAPPVAEQTLPVQGSSVPSNPWSAKTFLVRLANDGQSACNVAWVRPGAASGPVATTSNATYLRPGQTEYFGVEPGGSLAVIANPQ